MLVLLKPTLVPFALVGCRHRSWWVGLGVLALVSVPFAAMWLDYVTVVQNARDPNGLMYSLNQVPTVMIPVVAWLGSSRWDAAISAKGPASVWPFIRLSRVTRRRSSN